MPRPLACHTRRGFTLTEIAIVLGIVGIVLAAIWAASANISDNNKVKTATSELAFIVDGYKNMYSGNGVDTSGNVTCVGVTAGYFPQPMPQPGVTCANNNSLTYPQHPWGDYVKVQSDSVNQGISVLLHGLPQTACVQFAVQVVGISELLQETINGNTRNFPPLGNDPVFGITDITTFCDANANDVTLMFKAR